MPQGTIEVELVRGHDLKDVEAFGKSDPYAVLSCGHVTHRSRTIHDAGSNPIWNQTFLFDVSDDVTDLAVAIYDLEAHGRDVAMGTALIPLANVYTQRGIAPAKYKVLLRNGRYHGEVELGLKFFPKVYHGSLVLHLVQGHDLFSADVLDKSDPYAVITCNKQTVKSNTMENAGSEPVWDQTFAFTIDSEVSEDSFAKGICGRSHPTNQLQGVWQFREAAGRGESWTQIYPQGLNTGFWHKAQKLGTFICENREFLGMILCILYN